MTINYEFALTFCRSCKATIKIPKRGEYEDELAKRKKAMEKTLGIFSDEMKKGKSVCVCLLG